MKKILFIEDEAALQKTLGNMLRTQGFEVISALDGESGERLAKSQKPDLIILDLVLPQKDGFEVFADIKNDPVTADIPVVVLTNQENVEHIQRIVEMGAKIYLVKANYSLQQVVEKIKQVLLGESLA